MLFRKTKHVLSIGGCAVLLFVQAVMAVPQTRSDRSPGQETPKASPGEIKTVVVRAFKATHQGYSSDEVILQTELNRAFVDECQKQLDNVSPKQLNWTLLNLRKAGQLDVKTTQRVRRSYDHVKTIAEMCARMMEDKHSQSIDRLMADPVTRGEFDAAAEQIDPSIDAYLVRKAAFNLRKARRLRPELITRIANWGRVVTEYPANELREKTESLPQAPGIYIFRDESGYLYVGEALDLRARLQQHLRETDRASLAAYLKSNGFDKIVVEVHSFDEDSRIKETTVRRAYESELIRSRKPRFNIRP